MRTCAVPGCKGRFSFNGSKVHKLPDTEPLRSSWIDAVPALGEATVKAPSVCCFHFASSDYGKNRKYLKPTAIPTRHLSLSNESKDIVQFNDSDVIKSLLLDIPEVIDCRREDCQQLFLTAKTLQTYNQRLIAHIKSLNKRIDCLEEHSKKSTSSKFTEAANDTDFMLGPTQTRCLLNKTTKGRNWTKEEKEKALKFKKMCSHRCYNFVRKNLVPLPCTWELNSSANHDKKQLTVETEIKQPEFITPEVTTDHVQDAKKIVIWQDDLKSTEMIQVQNITEENQVQTVHHIVVPPEVWAESTVIKMDEGHEKIEFIVSSEMPSISDAACHEVNSQQC